MYFVFWECLLDCWAESTDRWKRFDSFNIIWCSYWFIFFIHLCSDGTHVPRPSECTTWCLDLLLSVVDEQGDNVRVYKVHTPFDPTSAASANPDHRVKTQTTTGECVAGDQWHLSFTSCLLSECFPPSLLQFTRRPLTGTGLWIMSRSSDALPAWSPAPAAKSKCSPRSHIKWERTPGSCASSSSCAGRTKKTSLTLKFHMQFSLTCNFHEEKRKK